MTSFVLGIAGGSGSGKTTLAHRLVDALGHDHVLLLQHDAYYHDLLDMPVPDPACINYDHPDSLETALCVSQLQALRRGQSVEQPVYNFSTHRRESATRTLRPHSIIIIEGILVLADEALRAEMDLRVFVDADADIRLLRRMERDLTSRGRTVQSVRDQYTSTVRPMYEQFVAPSKVHADLIVPHGGENDVALSVLTGYLTSRVS